jgi:hypothetical protein
MSVSMMIGMGGMTVSARPIGLSAHGDVVGKAVLAGVNYGQSLRRGP